MAADLDVAVAIAAIKAQLLDVDIVLERHRLHRLIPDARILRRKVVPDTQRHQPPEHAKGDDDLEDDQVGGFGEYIGHDA